MLFFSMAGKHNRNTAVVISPGSPGASEYPEHMFVNDHIQRPQLELLVAEVCTPFTYQTISMTPPSAKCLNPRHVPKD